ncbi:MAG: type IX secretion system protein PorQ [Bacteroidia bacterium]
MWGLSGLVALLWGQIAGGWSYDFLKLFPSGRAAGLGGLGFPGETEVTPAAHNPALLSARAHGNFHLLLQPYLGDIFAGYFAYAHHWPSVGTFWGGLQYVNYGEFRWTDEIGNTLGSFWAYEGAFLLGAVRHFGRWHAGMNLKVPFSVITIQQYRRAGLAADIGLLYNDTVRGWAFGLALRNVGTELYRPRGRPFAQPFPTSLQATLSYRIPHAPFRLHLGLVHLERWKMAYNDPLQPIRYDIFGNPVPPPPPPWTEHLFRHVVVGVEVLPDKVVTLRIAYHVQRRRELNPPGSPSLGGMSFGIGVGGEKWRLDYAYVLFFQRMAAQGISLRLRPFRGS